MKLNIKAFSLSAGIVWGLVIFLMTNISLFQGGTGKNLYRLSHFYYGYSFSFVGSIIGLIWGFVTAFAAGWIFSILYNVFCGKGQASS
jgi:hypothetical protein